ncbi:MAG TPA: pitrilysin family protein [Gemmatimonadales bacterium]|nr:pitrilysin family protein [Gemmatimonadales bacterium]
MALFSRRASALVIPLALCSAHPASAQAPAASATAPTPVGTVDFRTFTLPNGLRVIYAQDHTTPVVAVDIWYNVGSRNETPGHSGFAHLFEHLMFEGSAHAPKGLHSHLIERAGGEDNASTAEDRTDYYAVVPSNNLNVVLWLEADRMRALAVTEDAFHNQRETVEEERRLRVENEPYGSVFAESITWLFDSTTCFPYAHSVIGSVQDLDAAQLPEVQAFHTMYYAPNNATLVVTGDFRVAELRHLVNAYFATIPSQPPPPRVTCKSRLSPGVERRTITDVHAMLPGIARLYRIPPHDDPDTPALGLLTVILGEGESSRLNVGVVRRDKAALGIQASINPYDSRRGPGVLVIFGVSNQGVTPATLDSLIGRELDSLRTTGVGDDELAKAKNMLRADFVHSRETAIGRAEELQHYAMFHAALSEINTDFDRYLAVTSADVRRVARKYLDPANLLDVTVVAPASATAPTGGNGE